MSVLRVAGVQIENVVGGLDVNMERIRAAMAWAEEQAADVLLLPELALTGYPLEDLAHRRDFVRSATDALAELAREAGRTTTIVGTIETVPPQRRWDTRPRDLAIASALLCDGEVRGTYRKVLLPNYEVFDEARNFAPGTEPAAVWRIGGVIAGITICEDTWSEDGPPEAQAAAGAQVLLVQNASPFHREKPHGRLANSAAVARRNGLPLVYVNCVGAQDELVFDGGSIVVGAEGELLYRAPQFEPARFCLDLEVAAPRPAPDARSVHVRMQPDRVPEPPPTLAPLADRTEQAWCALVTGTREFIRRNGAGAVVLGLSGGIDSAVTATVAADALGPECVLGVSLPVEGTPQAELEDARSLASNLGIDFEAVAIDDVMKAVGSGLAPLLEGRPTGGVRKDLLARMRGAMIQAVAEELGYISLGTANKTELSIGSATLYGDMGGAFAPLKDCPKTLLYELARNRNEKSPVIPDRVLQRTPSALLAEELRVPAFDQVDAVVERYIELGEGLEEIVAAGFEPELVRGVLQVVDNAEPQRRLVPPGVKITRRAYGKDRRMPITNAWRPYRSEEARLAPATGGALVPGGG